MPKMNGVKRIDEAMDDKTTSINKRVFRLREVMDKAKVKMLA